MRAPYRFVASICLVAFLSVFALRPAASRAQGGATPVACDSTLVVLLLVAEHDYDYLSHMPAMPNIDLGQYTDLIGHIVSTMKSMDMSSEDVTPMQAVIDSMMSMNTIDLLAQDKSMGIGVGGSSTILQPGNVAGEDELCTTLRADVEKFLTVHLLADILSAPMDDSSNK